MYNGKCINRTLFKVPLMPHRIVDDSQRTVLTGKYCVYCGEIATTKDHFPPVINALAGYILPACSECNSIAGTEFPRDFIRRADYVKEKLQRKYSSILSEPPLEMDELLEKDEDTWLDALKHEVLRRRNHERIAWNAVSYLRLTAPTLAFVRSNAVMPTTIANVPKRGRSQEVFRSLKHKNFGKTVCPQCATEFDLWAKGIVCCSAECTKKYYSI